ncbi:high affinity cGMP-specific 3',5'-cyclic phosphodiesterase 9A isoform X2 [Anopheles darlingi]|uniref:high affinity cGMP-specific 3',5'-cyclic phosphodiesterase 9A isoform X2 n=1 Tax=Anopheles darlingi TaxID=43151 RepID=UPI0021003749|nr:high affinity cGMP-specific 3',5'-cyclic phosphodiesterase 9A isoform X2 [Anopheles darlingi]
MYHKDGTVDVKLLADLGYIADRLRSLEQKWDLTELKDLHRRIVLKFDDPPANVLRLRSALALSPSPPLAVPPGSPQEQEAEQDTAAEVLIVTTAASDSSSAHGDEHGTPESIEEDTPIEVGTAGCSGHTSHNDANDEVYERAQKLDELENLVIAFYRSCRRSSSGNVEPTEASRGGGELEPCLASKSKTTKKRKQRKKHKPGVRRIEEGTEHGQQRQNLFQCVRTMSESTEQTEQANPPCVATSSSSVTADRSLAANSQSGPTTVPANQQQQSVQQTQPLRSIYDGDDGGPGAQGAAEPPAALSIELDEDEDTVTLTTETSSECCSQQTVVAAGEETSLRAGPYRQSQRAVDSSGHGSAGGDSGNDTTTDEEDENDDEDDEPEADDVQSVSDDERASDDEGASGSERRQTKPTEAGLERPIGGTGAEGAVRRGSASYGVEYDPPDCEQSKRLRRHISELTNNFCTPQQFQQMYDNLDNITDNDLKLLVKELKRKIEFAERMNWLCLSSRPRGPPHRKTSLPKHTDVKQRFLEVCNQTLSDEVKAALRLPAFDSYEWEDWDVIHLMQTMFVELNLVDKFGIPIETLREWLYEVYKHYNDVPFHNYRHCFCVAQMMYAITWHTNLVQRLGELEVLVLLVSCICHDLDHPGYNNIYQINARTELALRYNDISPLENHHCSIAFRLLEHPECNIFRNMSKEMFKDVREGIIRCILATDMARHNEILTQFQEATPEFDYSNKVHTNLLCMVLIKVADISNEARPMDVAEPWVDRLLLEFFAQSAAEKSEGLPVTPFMDPDKVSKPGSQVRFIGLVLLPLFEALGELLPELTDLIITPVRVALDYYKRLNDAANKTRRSIAEAEAASSESGGSPQLPRSQSGISVKSRPELHDLPEGSESGDSETATEVDVAEKTSKFKVDTESIHRKQSHPNSRKGSREKRPSMIGEYYTTGTRIRGSHGNIQHTNRTYFGSNRAISLDQYSNNRRMSDGVPIQTVHSDNSVLYYHHQRQHRSLDHDTMYSSSDKSNSLNSSTHADSPNSQQQQQRTAQEDCENQNLHIPSAGKRLGKLFGSSCAGGNGGNSSPGTATSVAATNLKNNNNGSGSSGGGATGSGSAGKHLSRMLSFNQQQKLDKLRNNNNSQSKNNNNNNNNNNNTISNNKNNSSNHVRLVSSKDAASTMVPATASADRYAVGTLRRQAGGGMDGPISGSVGVVTGGAGGGSVDGRGTPGGRESDSNSTVATAGSGSGKSFMSRLRQLTGRLSFSFDSKESKKLQLLSGAPIAAKFGQQQQQQQQEQQRVKLATLEKSVRTVDTTGGPVAICGGGDTATIGSTGGLSGIVGQQHSGVIGFGAPETGFYIGSSVVMNQPKSISPILMQHRHSEVLGGMGGVAGGAARNRAYSLDVPIGARNCCRSLSGSTTGGGVGSSCGGSHKSLTFSLNNKSLNEDSGEGGAGAVSIGGGAIGNGGDGATIRNDTSLLLLVDDPSCSSMAGGRGVSTEGTTVEGSTGEGI